MISTCPGNADGSVWLEYAAGLRADRAEELVRHAAGCDACARQLKEAMELVGPESADAMDDAVGDAVDDARIPQLSSATEAWQRDMARRLAVGAEEEQARDGGGGANVLRFPARSTVSQRVFSQRTFSQRMGWMAAIAALVLIGFSIGWTVLHARSEDTLLARAYDADRRTELYLPGGHAVPMGSADRGEGDVREPTELLRLRVRAQDELEHDPASAHWHFVLGRIALAENDGRAARREMDTASALGASAADIKTGLAAANFEIGLTGTDPLAYARATDFYGQIIDSLGNGKESEAKAQAYFNRALCWEKQSVYFEAVKDYRQALALERDKSWREEMERRLRAAEAIQTRSEHNRSSAADYSAQAFTLAAQQDPEAAAREYELYLADATNSGLAAGRAAPEARAGLGRLAEAGRLHHDDWLHDMLAARATPVFDEAIGHLAQATQASARGGNDAALTEAQQASRLFKLAGSRAGQARADAEAVYVLQRTGKADACLNLGREVLARPGVAHYAWLAVYLNLELAACEFDHGSLGDSERTVQHALTLAGDAGLRYQRLRAEGFLVSLYGKLGQNRAAWGLLHDGLAECVDSRGARMNTYQFLYSMYLAVQARDLRWAAAGIADAASQAATFISNQQIEAYANEVAATAEARIGHADRAESAFGKASGILNAMPGSPAVQLYRADWEADRADFQASRGRLPDALEQLRNASSTAGASDNFSVRQKNDSELAQLYLRARDPQSAMHYSSLATADAERQLASTTGEIQRLTWEQGSAKGYRLLVESLAAMSRPYDALRAWEWYRSAPFRAGSPAPAADGLAALPILPAGRLQGLSLVVARLQDRFVVWAVPRAGQQAARMAVVPEAPEQVEAMAATLAQLCADRTSSQEAIRAIAARLNTMLFRDFEKEIGQETLLQIDLDPSLRQVPLAVLMGADGRYFGGSHTLVVLPAWWSLSPPPKSTLSADPRMLLVEGLPTSGHSATLATEYLETRDLAALYPHARLLAGAEASPEAIAKALPAAEVFHVNGHTVVRAGATGILLAAPDVLFSARTLHGTSLVGCRLAVVASCSSTQGGGDDVEDTEGLTHALLDAGAATVVGTLWDVDTKSSRTLMLAFYDAVRARKPPAEALRVAQATVAANGKTDHPFYWAAEEVFVH